MPIYEYRCNQCKKEFHRLFLNAKEIGEVKCQFCKSNNITKLLSSFCVQQTEDSRVTNFDPSKPRGENFYKDSRNIGLWTKKRMKELGVNLGSKVDEIIEKGRTGKILEEYNK